MKWLWRIALALFLVFTLLFLLAERMGWMTGAAVGGWIEAVRASRGGRWLAAALVIGLLSGDLLLPVPSSVVMTLSGSALGWAAGTAAAFAGAMGSALLGFGLCRRYSRPAFRRLVGPEEEARADGFMRRYGAWAILLSRSVPMLTEVVSCAAGLSGLSWRAFTLLSATGTLPLCGIYAWAGSRGVQSGFGWALWLAFILPALGFTVLRLFRRKTKRKCVGCPP